VARAAQARAAAAAVPAEAPARAASMGDVLDLDDIHVEFAPDLVAMVLDPATGLDVRIANMRRHVATTFGLVLPEMRLTDDALLPPGSYRVRIHGIEMARDRLMADRVLALGAPDIGLDGGEPVREPVYGAPALWLPPRLQEEAALAGATIVAPAEVLATHLLEVIKQNLGRLMTLKALRRLLDELTALSDPDRAAANRRLIEELVPDKVPVDLLLSVLRLLLEERVSVRNLALILEAVAEARPASGGPEAVVEAVRQRLGFQLVAGLRRPDGTIPLIQLAPEWEDTFAEHEIAGDAGRRDVALPPDLFQRLTTGLAAAFARAAEAGHAPALVAPSRRRRFLRTLMVARGLGQPVLSFDEIGLEARPALVGTVAR